MIGSERLRICAGYDQIGFFREKNSLGSVIVTQRFNFFLEYSKCPQRGGTSGRITALVPNPRLTLKTDI
jgi:hypothetical protein